jgi:hypothetical protein
MKCLHIQLQPELCSGDAAKHVDDLVAIATKHDLDPDINIERGDEDGAYINVNIYTEDVRSLWATLKAVITANQSLFSSTIVCCEGNNGWDDYLLLHHFDKTTALDTLR